MDPISAITTALTSIKTASEIARLLIDADVSLQKAELKLKLADLVVSARNNETYASAVRSGVHEKSSGH
jgi:hypothetical protein